MKYRNLFPEKFNIKAWENLFNIYQDASGRYFFNLKNTIQFKNGINPAFCFKYVGKSTDNLFHLSYKFYGTIDLWWVIGYTNNLIDPFTLDGKDLNILNKEIVGGLVNQIL